MEPLLKPVRIIITWLCFLSANFPAKADVRLPALFSDHAVLQKSPPAAIWGWADPGESVRVQIGSIESHADASSDGRWRVHLDLSALSAEPHELIVQGKNRLTIRDVLVGEVWLLSGQSNMEWTLDQTPDFKSVVIGSGDVGLRHFKPATKMTSDPQDDFDEGKWVVAEPEAIGRFSAVGYYFARQLRDRLKRPVGLINLTLGGSGIVSWISEPALLAEPTLRESALKDQARIRDYPETRKAWETVLPAWESTHGRTDFPSTKTLTWDTLGKETGPIQMPTRWEKVGLPYGSVWLKKEFTLDPQQLHFSSLELGVIDGCDTVQLNDTTIGSTGFLEGNKWRNYPIPTGTLRAGTNVVLIRIFASGGPAGFSRQPALRTRTEGFPLGGTWETKIERDLGPAPEGFPIRPELEQKYLASQLLNGLIAPAAGYSLAGVLWYQGETNIDGHALYPTQLTALVRDWRNRWGQGDFPFYLMQLPAIGPLSLQPEEGNVARFRRAQDTVLQLPNTGRAVLIDGGETENIHPGDKRTPGERLARIALHRAYGDLSVVADGPAVSRAEFTDAKVILHFNVAGGRLAARTLPATYRPNSDLPETRPLPQLSSDSPLQGMALRNADGQWFWAHAEILGEDQVVVSSPQVANPTALRYAWVDFPICNLVDTSGLPAAPFQVER